MCLVAPKGKICLKSIFDHLELYFHILDSVIFWLGGFEQNMKIIYGMTECIGGGRGVKEIRSKTGSLQLKN